MRTNLVVLALITASTAIAGEPQRVVKRRYVVPAGQELTFIDEAYAKAFKLGTRALPLSEKEAARIEARIRESLNRKTLTFERKSLVEQWPSYVLLFERLSSETGEKVFVRGFDRSLFDGEPPSAVTVHVLQQFEVDDGGCSVWRVLYDVRTGSVDEIHCNGVA